MVLILGYPLKIKRCLLFSLLLSEAILPFLAVVVVVMVVVVVVLVVEVEVSTKMN